MLKWFSIAGIKKEITERIRWSKPSEMSKFFAQVMVFVVAFAIFFVVADFFVVLFLGLLRIGGV